MLKSATNSRPLVILEDSSVNSLGGGQKVTLQVMEALRETFVIYVFDYTGSSTFLDLAKRHGTIAPPIPCRRPPLPVRGRAMSSLAALVALRASSKHVLDFLRQKRACKPIIYATTTKNLALACWLSFRGGHKYVFHAHLVYSWLSPIRWALDFAFRKATFILCVSHTVLKYLPGKRQLLYNAVELYGPASRKLRTKKLIVATLSSLSKFKGVRFFMKSHEFLKQPDKVEYRIYGEGSEKEGLRHLETTNVRLMGFTADVTDVLRNEVSLIVIPSLIPEACPMSLLEALSFGIPVIGTNKGGLAELIRDGEVGFQVPPGNPASIAEKIDYFMDNPDVYEQFSANALEYAKRFNLEKYKETVKELFQNL